MIVPRNRLLFWFALIGVPFGVLAGVQPAALAPCAGVIGTLLLIVVWDAVRSRRVFAGIQLDAPAVSRLTLNQAGEIEFRLKNERRRSRQLRVALPLPPELATAWDEMDVTLPDSAEWSKFPVSCRPEKRGNYRIRSARLEAPSPLGFWDARRQVQFETEIRVYPNLQTERKGLELLFRGASGVHSQRQIGKGREFEKLRDYVPGDGLEDIHWKATARRGRPITKVFQIERTQEVYVAIDTSRLSAREGAIERHLSSALLLGLAARQQGDLFGLLSFSDRVESFVRARNGSAHYHACRDAIYGLQPREVNPDFDEVCRFIRMRLRRRSLVIFLTALDDPVLAENFGRNVNLISRQHLVVAGMMRPAGLAPIFSDPAISTRDDLYEQLGGHLRWQKVEEVARSLQHRGVKLAVFDGEQMALRLVSEYLNIKKRQIL